MRSSMRRRTSRHCVAFGLWDDINDEKSSFLLRCAPMKRFFFLLLAAVVLLSTARLQAEEIRHSFFVAGPSFTGIIDEEGKESWDSGRGGARDGWVLPSGNVLIAWSDVVQEFDRDHENKVVFEYKKNPVNKEIGIS